jgi:acetylornithine deacetylase/succinyl-diaminopimelate desuccinylase family protein
VVARLWGQGDRTVTYCSHLDVVPAGDRALWDHDPFGGEIAGGLLYGRGSADAKGPVAASIEAATALAATPEVLGGTLELALVADEEAMGFKGAGFLVSEGLVGCDKVIVGEPTSLKVVHAQRGACWLRLTVHGRAAHGSAPERGRNAIVGMAEIVRNLEDVLPDVEHDVLGGPSVNVGTISGGEKVNIVPASCVVEIDRRVIPGETEQEVLSQIWDAVERARRRYPDIEADVDLQFFGKPFEVPTGAEVVRAMSEGVEAATGSAPELAGFRGASDARFFAEAGAEVLVCGPGNIAVAHTAGESVELSQVHGAALAYAVAFSRLLSP